MDSQRRIVSGMRPSGRLHLGHYQGVLKDWTRLQHEYECFFCIADWHALTTHYLSAEEINQHVLRLAIDWLAVGISPSSATLFVQSHVPEQAELHLLLAMICPESWLQRLPVAPELLRGGRARERQTYGLLGAPLLQVTDTLLYRAGWVPATSSQLPHVELARDLARRFNYLYGSESDFEEKARMAIRRLGKKGAKLYSELRRAYQEQGDQEALTTAQALVKEQQSISLGDQERLYGYLEGVGRLVLPEPQPLLLDSARVLGLDGERMSGYSGNAIYLCDGPEDIEEKLRRMPTDPARVHRTDPGEPERCPVWRMHQTHSEPKTCHWAEQGCRSAGIGCLECKEPLMATLVELLEPFHARAREYEDNQDLVRSILAEGAEVARAEARETLVEVRQAIGLQYR